MDGLANNTVYLSDDRPLQQSRTCKVDNAKEKLSYTRISLNAKKRNAMKNKNETVNE